jgi:hypothetical protein
MRSTSVFEQKSHDTSMDSWRFAYYEKQILLHSFWPLFCSFEKRWKGMDFKNTESLLYSPQVQKLGRNTLGWPLHLIFGFLDKWVWAVKVCQVWLYNPQISQNFAITSSMDSQYAIYHYCSRIRSYPIHLYARTHPESKNERRENHHVLRSQKRRRVFLLQQISHSIFHLGKLHDRIYLAPRLQSWYQYPSNWLRNQQSQRVRPRSRQEVRSKCLRTLFWRVIQNPGLRLRQPVRHGMW